MKERILRFTAMLLVLCFAFALVACNGGGNGDGGNGGGGNGGDESGWGALDFEGKTLKIQVSANQDSEVTFKPADVYLQGPDQLKEDAVLQAVYNRNAVVKSTLNINVEYDTTDLAYDKVLDDVAQKIQVNDEYTPDIYSNDAFGLARAMLSNYLYNVANPTDRSGNPLQSYFDFESEDSGWYREYMEGMTFSPEKQYVLAGDYFIDVLRMAWLFYVNLDKLADSLAMQGTDKEVLYEIVENREWTYDEMIYLCDLAAVPESGNDPVEEDEEDDVIGAIISHVTAFIFTPASSLSTIKMENGVPKIVESPVSMYAFAQKFNEFYNARGVYYRQLVLDSTEYFMNGNILFGMSVLGEMESEDMRNLDFDKGLVPFPIYDKDVQKDYNTVIHDQAEVGAILSTTENFTMASAYMQYINELSTETLQEYYEGSLKLKYNDDASTKKMIDIVRDRIASPFDLVFKSAVYSMSGVTVTDAYTFIKEMAETKTDNFNSKYNSAVDAWKQALAASYNIFLNLY